MHKKYKTTPEIHPSTFNLSEELQPLLIIWRKSISKQKDTFLRKKNILELQQILLFLIFLKQSFYTSYESMFSDSGYQGTMQKTFLKIVG